MTKNAQFRPRQNMMIADIFADEPVQWGLRGDPFLWRELKANLKAIAMPENVEDLKIIIENECEKMTGQPVVFPKSIAIERFRSHGMSSGYISPKFWLEEGIPLLLSRHKKLS